MTYLIVKSLHIIAVISWMAGILYLGRLLIYHTENLADKSRSELLGVMESKLYRIITLPAMVATWVFAIIMISMRPDLFKAGWFHAKFSLVLVLTWFTTYVGRMHKNNLKMPGSLPSSKTLRILNEVPTLLMVIIVFLAVTKAF